MNGFKFVDPRPRTFSLMYAPNVVDPTGEFTLVEFNPERRLSAAPLRYRAHTGWRARVIEYLIRRWLPEPKDVYGRGL